MNGCACESATAGSAIPLDMTRGLDSFPIRSLLRSRIRPPFLHNCNDRPSRHCNNEDDRGETEFIANYPGLVKVNES